MSGGKEEVVQVAPVPPWIGDKLAANFTVHRLWEAADPEALVAEVAPRIRGIATIGQVGAKRDLIEKLPRLEIISCFAVGVDAVDLGYCREKGIIVTNTPDVLTDCVADLGMGLVIAIARRIVEGDRYVRAGRWLQGDLTYGSALKGKTLGIVGLGRIGQELADRAEAFKMTIAYHNRHRKDGVQYPYYPDAVSLAEASDFLALTCPGGQATHHLVNEAVLKALGPKGFLINIARGSVVDEPALVRALQDGTIAGAALDVFEAEPRVPEALFALDNVIVQPHQASATMETRTAMGDLMIENLVRHLSGRDVLTRVV